MRDFNSWLDNMRKSINGYDYYLDFEKVYENVDKVKVELNILNSLINSNDIEEDFRKLVEKYPEVLKCIPLLLAVRTTEIFAQDADGAFNYDFTKLSLPVDQYVVFMRKTGLFDLLENHIINNLYDYVMGVEAGLDSNGRKNRGGHQMEDLVEEFIIKTGKPYYKEMYLAEIESKWGLDLSAISSEGTSSKRWDFVVEGSDSIYMIETNFYTSSGSKLNETARSYKMIAEETERVEGAEFVWITDGGGWKSARRNLEETFNVMDYIFNISDMECDALETLFEKE